MRQLGAGRRGVTLIELIVTVTIVAILAAGIVPLTRMTAKRTREIELRRNLRIMRTAIDEFKKSYDKAVDEKKIRHYRATSPVTPKRCGSWWKVLILAVCMPRARKSFCAGFPSIR
jgi:prepilin-type N-terminal cleavage/methylation domain-containing protein